jgi:hypothetical protein
VRTVKATEVAQVEAARGSRRLAEVVRRPRPEAADDPRREASKQREILEAGATRPRSSPSRTRSSRLALEGIGAADATRAKLLAEAEGTKAKLLAEAEGTRAKLLAEAEGTKAKLLAEAEGALKKAQAFASMEESARSLLVLERLPEVIRAFAPVAGAVAAPMGNIDKWSSSTREAPSSPRSRYASTVPATLFQTVQAAGARPRPPGLLGRLGVAPAGDGKTPPLAEVRPVAEPKEAGGGKPR